MSIHHFYSYAGFWTPSPTIVDAFFACPTFTTPVRAQKLIGLRELFIGKLQWILQQTSYECNS